MTMVALTIGPPLWSRWCGGTTVVARTIVTSAARNGAYSSRAKQRPYGAATTAKDTASIARGANTVASQIRYRTVATISTPSSPCRFRHFSEADVGLPPAKTRSRCRRMFVSTSNSRSRSSEGDDKYSTENVHESSSILFLSPTSWPEPGATAAGARTMSLLRHFANSSSSLFHSVHFGCGASIPSWLSASSSPTVHDTAGKISGVEWHHIKPNRSEDMKELLRNIESSSGPIKAVVFDRFYAEEAFSFRIREQCPDAVHILDMQDVHSLRLGRQRIVERFDDMNIREKNSRSGSADSKCIGLIGGTDLMTDNLVKEVIKFGTTSSMLEGGNAVVSKGEDTFLRELASVHRSDLVLVCSSVELQLMERVWNVPKWKLVPAPFFCDGLDQMSSSSSPANTNTFAERTDFVSLGGFKHPPNVDSVRILHREIWPRIRARLPNARLHVYGAYPTNEVKSMHDERTGFIVKGRVEDLDEALLRRRVMLAPLRFGAGVKGKIVDAWRCGCPVVTTPIGAEGMTSGDVAADETSCSISDWGGNIASNSNDFVDAAIWIYSNDADWEVAKTNGQTLLRQLFDGTHTLPVVESSISDALLHCKERRKHDMMRAVMWHQTARSTEYFSRWIELKENIRDNHPVSEDTRPT